MPNELASRLEPIVAEAVTTAGFDLDSLEVQQAGRRQLVKVVVDSDDGVGLDEVAEVSRTVSAALDENEHVLASAYTLEVTSPGLDRPLTQRRHWRRARFRLVKITPVEGPAYLGRVGHAGEKSVRVLVDGRIKDVSYQSVAKAVVEVEFKQPPAEELKQLTADENEKKEESK
ncbi:ribosome maturation factor RimP [Amycolatopsis echigonensis]|uniref:Ribosome maturation factor RimP n=1 Tax=Amycolatopsis echigonensis TaxID=2576905 RepID=A0A2N3WVL7_9PSEU|nr:MULTISPECIES: ribosome maturation factor RimP [Amycolatopsis]MBB2505988.1 ribosome maturation factor RimP [Amycolatopsis echigonensis]PKV97908.1 ribosome maturation factor RimP [Amycolatopsis niigatensis]